MGVARVILPADVPAVWRAAQAQLERAFHLCANDTIDRHYQLLVKDTEQLWQIDEGRGWALTRVIDTKHGRMLEIVALSGHGAREWIGSFFEKVEAWGKSVGCAKVIFTGRKGWAKLLKDYQVTRVTCEKEL